MKVTWEGKRRSCSLSPNGDALNVVRGTLFPLRVRLTLGSPGLPGNMLLVILLSERLGSSVLGSACHPAGTLNF
ncbi:hypothetical protein [Paenibacillus fonticola]|uniref:hypothetical protein n=1 Tax=Paenibacillus fonticola TaxID=379896 RepID=UPI0012FB31AB|nr:hypothetical protein [Paenibacillus fonticola]